MVAKQRKIETQSPNISLLIFTLRQTFFDLIDENIEYPRSINSDIITAVSQANDKIITTSKWTDFSLFSYEEDGWTESVIEFSDDFSNLDSSSEQLLTVPFRANGR